MILRISELYHVNLEWLMGFDVEANPARNREFTIFVPSPKFVKMTSYMSQEDYENMLRAFENAYKKMKELGVSLDD